MDTNSNNSNSSNGSQGGAQLGTQLGHGHHSLAMSMYAAEAGLASLVGGQSGHAQPLGGQSGANSISLSSSSNSNNNSMNSNLASSQNHNISSQNNNISPNNVNHQHHLQHQQHHQPQQQQHYHQNQQQQQQQDELDKPKRNPFCSRCRNHGKTAQVKGHKRHCEYRDCQCEGCKLVEWRQVVSAAQIKRRRYQKQDEESGRRIEISPPVLTRQPASDPATLLAKTLMGNASIKQVHEQFVAPRVSVGASTSGGGQQHHHQGAAGIFGSPPPGVAQHPAAGSNAALVASLAASHPSLAQPPFGVEHALGGAGHQPAGAMLAPQLASGGGGADRLHARHHLAAVANPFQLIPPAMMSAAVAAMAAGHHLDQGQQQQQQAQAQQQHPMAPQLSQQQQQQPKQQQQQLNNNHNHQQLAHHPQLPVGSPLGSGQPHAQTPEPQHAITSAMGPPGGQVQVHMDAHAQDQLLLFLLSLSEQWQATANSNTNTNSNGNINSSRRD